MFLTFACLLPACAVHIMCFGFGLLWHFIICASAASAAEALCMRLRGRSSLTALKDWSLQVTVLIYCLAIPPYLNCWYSIIGILFGTLIVKHAFGGLGQNVFNPAMASYVFLLISVPSPMSQWIEPNIEHLSHYSISGAFEKIILLREPSEPERTTVIAEADVDGSTYATPLNLFKQQLIDKSKHVYVKNILSPSINNNGGSLLSVAYLVGGICLFLMGIITFTQPIAFLISMLITGLIYNKLGASLGFASIESFDHVMIGASIMGAFFILTDPVSSPTSRLGKVISASIAGFFVVTIRTFGNYPDAVALAALVANSINPLINQLVRPKRFGDLKPTGEKA